MTNEWKPIETAPHEVNVLLAYWDDLLGAWHMECGMASWGRRLAGASNMSWREARHPLDAPPRSTGEAP